jgi:C1A family cysteine protease
MSKFVHGWKPDAPDIDDHLYEEHAYKVERIATLPTSVNLSPLCSPAYDQGQRGSCTGNGIAALIEFLVRKQKNQLFMPSRLFIYYNERVMEGTVNEDAGAQIRDGIKSVVKLGVCSETEWPYSDDDETFKERPSAQCYKDALLHQALSYQNIPARNLTLMKNSLAAGYPFTFGFRVYESFESNATAQTGIMPMPSRREQFLGGHCVDAFGYDDASGHFLIRNSWGIDWGMTGTPERTDRGYFTMPYDFLLKAKMTDDFWTIRSME